MMAENGGAPILMHQSVRGGHLGFCFHQVDETDPRLREKQKSWAPDEAARFLKHVEDHRLQLKNWYF